MINSTVNMVTFNMRSATVMHVHDICDERGNDKNAKPMNGESERAHYRYESRRCHVTRQRQSTMLRGHVLSVNE